MGTSMKRERPPMPPLAVRVTVAERQFVVAMPASVDVYKVLKKDWSLGKRLRWLLLQIFQAPIDADEDVLPHALDHDPALILRQYNHRIKDVAARYTPHAHDPDKLIYRRKGNHDQKTFGRKEGAAKTVTTKGSDVYLKAKFNRLEGRTKKRPKKPWPKGRKLQSRRFEKRRKA